MARTRYKGGTSLAPHEKNHLFHQRGDFFREILEELGCGVINLYNLHHLLHLELVTMIEESSAYNN